MKIIKIMIKYENHMKRNDNHKRKSYEKMKIIRKYKNHMKRNDKHKKKIVLTNENYHKI